MWWVCSASWPPLMADGVCPDKCRRGTTQTGAEGRLGAFPLNYLNLNISRRTKMSHSLNVAPCERPSVRVESAHAGLNPVEGRACPRHLFPQPACKNPNISGDPFKWIKEGTSNINVSTWSLLFCLSCPSVKKNSQETIYLHKCHR